MESPNLAPVFQLFLWFAAAATAAEALVEDPTNVSLQCHNLQNIIRWNYEELLLPGLRFRVSVQPYEGDAVVIWVDPPALHANISNFYDLVNGYLIFVTAVIGQNESDPAPPDGIVYSYYMDSFATEKCYLDLPPVSVTILSDDNLRLSFTHPCSLYRQLAACTRRKRRSQSEQLPRFQYNVALIGQKHQHHFSCVHSVCEEKFPVEAEAEKPCVNITGEMTNMAVKSTQLYCAVKAPPPQPQNNTIIYIVIAVVSVCVVGFILFLVYKKKTSPDTEIPNPLIFQTPNGQFSPVEEEDRPDFTFVEPSSPTLLLPPEDKSDLPPAGGSSSELPDLRFPIRPFADDEGAPGAVDEAPNVDHGQGYTAGDVLEGNETTSFSEEPSVYERRGAVGDAEA